MKTTYRQHMLAVAVTLLITLVMGCATASRRGTALDYIKKDLRSAATANGKIAKEDKKVPVAVMDSLKPKLGKNALEKTIKKSVSRFNVNSSEVSAREFFLGLVENTNTNLMVHPNVKGNISVKLNGVTVDEVLNMTSKVYGYGIEREGNNIRVYPAELQMKTFHLNYLDMLRTGTSQTKISSSGISAAGSADTSSETNSSGETSSSAAINSEVNTSSTTNVWNQLKTTIETMVGSDGGRKVAISPMTGMIIVQALPQELLKVEKFLSESERFLNRQVILEAKILEVELGDGYRSGINWALLSKNLNATQLGGNMHADGAISATPEITSNSIVGNPSAIEFTKEHKAPLVAQKAAAFGGILALGLHYGNLGAFVEMLSSQGNVQVLSNPRISTANNQKALIKVGTDEFFVTNVTNTTTTGSGSAVVNSPSVDLEAFFSGIALDVTPQINEDGNITLHIHPTISSVAEKTKTITTGSNASAVFPLAKSTIRESDTIIRAKNGQFVVIGGLMQDKTSEIVSGVPLLKDIPYLGTAFRQTRQQSTKTELVILLRPIVVNDAVWKEQISEAYNRFDKLDLGFHLGGNVELYGNLAESKEF